MENRILIVGTGAMATLFAARLSAAGVAVMMLGTWQDGLNAINTHGVELDRQKWRVEVTDRPEKCEGIPSAIVLVKSWQTERASRQLEVCLQANGVALTLQNGIGNSAVMARMLGEERVATGVATLGASLKGPGCAVSGGEGTVSLQNHPRLELLEGMLQSAGFQIQVVDDVRALVWRKLGVNAAINPLTALLHVRNGELLDFPTASRLMDDLAEEAASVARAMGIVLPEPDPAVLAREVAQRTAQNFSSMLQDMLRGSPTEIDAINGAIAREGERLGISTPVNLAVFWMIKKAQEKSLSSPNLSDMVRL